jgi:hypothetical protein
MPNAPHVHSVDETKSNIRRIEHNASGPGPGPSGKKAGPPMPPSGGSGANLNSGGDANTAPKSKGSDYV